MKNNLEENYLACISNYCFEIAKTVLIATTIVAGTNKNRRVPKIDEIIFPISIPRIAASRTRP